MDVFNVFLTGAEGSLLMNECPWEHPQFGCRSTGDASQDRMANLAEYIADLRTQYEDGRIDMDANKLMMMGYQKFKNLGLSETLEAPSTDKADIMALKTQTDEITALKTTMEQLQAQGGQGPS